MTTLAGNGYLAWADGLGSAASLNHATYLALDSRGNVVVGDYDNNRIRLLSAVGGMVLVWSLYLRRHLIFGCLFVCVCLSVVSSCALGSYGAVCSTCLAGSFCPLGMS